MIDAQRLVDLILAGIEKGVAESLEGIKSEAQRRAPVRKLFKGGGRRKFLGPIGVHNQIGQERAYFMARRVGRTPSGDYLRSAPNSSAPMARNRIGGEDFRRISRERGYNLAFRLQSRNPEILARARVDVVRGRGLHVVPGVTDARGKGLVEYGGQLRDSIEVVGPFRSTEGVTGYVKAAAFEHGFNYAYAQEFGTAHNAPQPYLRPALRSYLTKITNNQRYALRSALERTTYPIQIIASSVELVIHPSGSFQPTGGGDALLKFGNRFDRALG